MANGQNNTNGPSAKRAKRTTNQNRNVTRSGNGGLRRTSSGTSSGTSRGTSGSVSAFNRIAASGLQRLRQNRKYTIPTSQNAAFTQMRRAANSSKNNALLNSIVAKTKKQQIFARAIVKGDLKVVEALMQTMPIDKERGVPMIPSSWYTSVFDTEGRKLVAFATHVALKNGMDHDHAKILEIVINDARTDTHISTCTAKSRNRCVVHDIARGATTRNHVSKIAKIISNARENGGTLWHTMLQKKNKSGRTPAQHALSGAVAEELGHSHPFGQRPSNYNRLTPAERKRVNDLARMLARMHH